MATYWQQPDQFRCVRSRPPSRSKITAASGPARQHTKTEDAALENNGRERSGEAAHKDGGRSMKFAGFAAMSCRDPRDPSGGYDSCNAIAGQLNARKIATARGRWTH